ncbi:BTB/POZ domain-containing protein At3g50840-like [Wolffia australiana]
MLPGYPPPQFQIPIQGLSYPLDMRRMANKSAKIARMLTNGEHDLSGAPPSSSAFELAAKFCYGFPPDLSPENVLAVASVAFFLEMTERHSPSNLLRISLAYFKSSVLPHWNETLRCLRGGAAVLRHAAALNLPAACLHSLSIHAVADPRLLTTPLESDGQDRRHVDWLADDPADLPLDVFLLFISAVAGGGAPPLSVSRCLLRHARKNSNPSAQRLVIEAVEELLPEDPAALEIEPLLSLLGAAVAAHVSERCRRGIERRAGLVLGGATSEALIRAGGDSVEGVVGQFCLRGGWGLAEAGRVAGAVEGYLGGAELGKEEFARMGRMLGWLLDKAGKSGDGVYRAVDSYFALHGELTEKEREEVCRAALDCRRLSAAAREHAARNERMPLRVVARVLYLGQLQIRNAIAGASMIEQEEEEEGEEEEEEEEGERGGGKKFEEEEEEKGKREGGERRKKGLGLGLGFWRKLRCKDVGFVCSGSLRRVNPGE